MSPARINTLVAVRGAVDVNAVQEMVVNEPGLGFAGLIDNDRDWAARATYNPDVLLIVCTTPSEAILDLIEQEKATSGLPVVVVCGDSQNGFVRQVFEAGADDIVMAPDISVSGPQVFFAIEKATSRRAAPVHSGNAGGHLICVLDPKGGTGKTLTASNLAVAL